MSPPLPCCLEGRCLIVWLGFDTGSQGSTSGLVDVYVWGCLSQEAVGLLQRSSHPELGCRVEADEQGTDSNSRQVPGRKGGVEVQRNESFATFRAPRHEVL